MFCKFCGTQMNDGDLFCPNCGKQQTNESGSASTASTTSAAQQTASITQTAQPQQQAQTQAAPYVAKKSNANVIGAVVGVVIVAAVLYIYGIKPQQEAKRIAETQQKVAEFLRSVGQNEHANAIIKYGINAKDGSGWTALKVAARNNSRDVAQLLINAKADINAKDNDGWTALMIAAEKNSTDVAKLLIQAGADVNAKKNDGVTALIVAAANNSNDVAQLLINAKADVNARTNDGYTALAFAKDAQMAQLLRNAGATY